MPKSIYILFISWVMMNSCTQLDRNSQDISQDVKNEEEIIKTDTLLEPNDPKLLDLSVHQLFLDTTRNSQFFQNLQNWNISEGQKSSIQETFNYFFEGEKPQKVNWKTFPRKFIELQKLNGEYVLYDRCDGGIPRWELQDSAFVYFGVHEPSVYPIYEMIHFKPKELKVALRSYQKYDTLTIHVTNDNRVFLATYFDQNQFITPIENIDQFDLVVNHCPTQKMFEFKGFGE